MKILHLGNVPLPEGHPQKQRIRQHPGKWVINLALAQKAAGFKVEIVSQAHKSDRDFDCEIDGIPVHYLRTFHPYRHLTFFALDSHRMAKMATSLAPDIIVVHGTEDVYGHAAVHSGIPFCILAQGLFFQIIPALNRPPTIHERALRFGENRVWRKTRYAVAVSRFVGEALQHQYPHLDITQIPLTYAPDLDRPISDARGNTLAYVGSVDERKGIVYLVEAIRLIRNRFPDLVLNVCGNPPESTATQYTKDAIQTLRKLLGKKLVLHGTVPPSTVFSVLRRSTALVAPSLNEMFGCQLVEALMCGAHGIVTEETGMAENVRIAGNGTIVPQRDPSSLASAIDQVLSNPPTIEMMESARSRLREYLGPQKVAAMHVALYERILKESRRKLL